MSARVMASGQSFLAGALAEEGPTESAMGIVISRLTDIGRGADELFMRLSGVRDKVMGAEPSAPSAAVGPAMTDSDLSAIHRLLDALGERMGDLRRVTSTLERL